MPAVPNRELLILRFVELRDAGEAESLSGRRTRAALVEEFRPELARFARAWARNCPTAAYDLDDLLQESVIVLLRVLSGYDPTRSAFVWLLKVSLRNHLRDVHQKESLRRTEPGDSYVQHARIDGAAMARVIPSFP